MPRIRIYKLENDEYQVAVLSNKPGEATTRLAKVKGGVAAKAACGTLLQEWVAERDQKLRDRAPV